MCRSWMIILSTVVWILCAICCVQEVEADVVTSPKHSIAAIAAGRIGTIYSVGTSSSPSSLTWHHGSNVDSSCAVGSKFRHSFLVLRGGGDDDSDVDAPERNDDGDNDDEEEESSNNEINQILNTFQSQLRTIRTEVEEESLQELQKLTNEIRTKKRLKQQRRYEQKKRQQRMIQAELEKLKREQLKFEKERQLLKKKLMEDEEMKKMQEKQKILEEEEEEKKMKIEQQKEEVEETASSSPTATPKEEEKEEEASNLSSSTSTVENVRGGKNGIALKKKKKKKSSKKKKKKHKVDLQNGISSTLQPSSQIQQDINIQPTLSKLQKEQISTALQEQQMQEEGKEVEEIDSTSMMLRKRVTMLGLSLSLVLLSLLLIQKVLQIIGVGDSTKHFMG